MRIRPAEIEIPEHNPFENDLLDRELTIKTLTNLLQNLEGPYTMSIDSSWGNGKTTFLNMWKQHLVNEKFPVVSFNAWDTDFAGDPFVALSSELLNALECLNGKHNPQLKTLRTRAYQLGKVILAKGIPGAIALAGVAVSAETNDPYITYLFGVVANFLSTTLDKLLDKVRRKKPYTPIAYPDAKSAISSFKKELKTVVETLLQDSDQKPLVIVIDELDRCRPSYAVELLEIAKHFFSVNNIVFVLAIDKAQLSHAIKAIYGNEFDAIGYLRRFVDLEFRLPDTNRTKFLTQLMSKSGMHQIFDEKPGMEWGKSTEVQELLLVFLNPLNTSLRQTQQSIYRFGLVLASFDPPSVIAYSAAAVMIILRTIDPDTYYSFTRSNMMDKDVSDRVFSLPGIANLKSTDEGATFDALLIMAQYELSIANHSSSRLVESSLYDRIREDDAKDASDSLKLLHAEKVSKFLFDNKSIFNLAQTGKPVGFHLAAQHIELLYDILPDQPELPDTPETIHQSA